MKTPTTMEASAMVAAMRTGKQLTPLPKILARQNIRSKLLDTAALADLPPLEPLVDRYLYRDTLAELYGPPGCGKTFLAIGWALHVSTGTWWERKAVNKAPVLYVQAEGVRMTHRRVKAWSDFHRVHNLAAHEPIHWHPGAVNIFDAEEADGLVEVVGDLAPGLVVIDTLARCTAGADEISGKDMGRIIDACDRVRSAAGCCVLLVHHMGKDASKGGRGHSALQGALDVEIELNKAGLLKVTKVKDFEEPNPLTMSLRQVGDSCVITTLRGARDDAEITAAHAAVLEALRLIATPEGVAGTVWRDVAMSGELVRSVSKSTFYAAVSELVESGAVRNIGSKARPLYVPESQGSAGLQSESPNESETIPNESVRSGAP